MEDDKPIPFYTSRRHKYQGEYACVDNGKESLFYIYGNTIHNAVGYIGDGWIYHYAHTQFDWEYGNEHGGEEHGFKLPDYYVCFSYGDGENSGTGRPYGYTARYTMLMPQLTTLGAADHYQKEFVNENAIDCHVQLAPSYFSLGRPYKGKIPHRNTLYTDDYKNPWSFVGKSFYGGAPDTKGIAKNNSLIDGRNDTHHMLITRYSIINDSISQPVTSYFGTRHTKESLRSHIAKMPTNIWQTLNTLPTMVELAESQRCPCPALPTTPPPEFATKPPLEVR